MPLVDLPLEQLRAYQGRNPKPVDFDQFWDSAIEEVAALGTAHELAAVASPATFAQCFELRFQGVHGASIFAKACLPNHNEPVQALIEFHGYSMRSPDWVEAYKWAANGVAYFALDCRGQGGRSEDVGGTKGTTLRGHIVRGLDDAPERLLFRSVYLDAAQLARIVMSLPSIDASRVATYGASQGGGLSLACAALEPRVSRCAAVFPFLCDFQRVWELDLAKDAYDDVREFFRKFDPRHERESAIFERLGYIDVQHLAPRIRAEVRMYTGLMDTICPPSSQFAAFNKISAPKTMAIYPDFGHEGLPGLGDDVYEFVCR